MLRLVQVIGQKGGHALFEPVSRPQRVAAGDKSDVSASRGDFKFEMVGGSSQLQRQIAGHEGIVAGVEEEGGDADAVKEPAGAGFAVVVVCAGEAVEGRGDAVVEVGKGAQGAHFLFVEGEIDFNVLHLLQQGAAQGAHEVPLVELRPASIHVLGDPGQVQRRTDRSRRSQPGLGAKAAEEVQQDICAE